MDKKDIKSLEEAGYVADSKKVRENFIEQLSNGEKKLEEIQAELKEIQKTAKKKGLFTRKQLEKENYSLEQAIIIANRQKIVHAHNTLLKKLPTKQAEKRNKI